MAFDLGRISMPITMTMTNPARATEGDGSAHGYQAAKISHSQTARRIFSHLFSSTTVRKSLMSTIDLFKSSYRTVRQSRCSSIICIFTPQWQCPVASDLPWLRSFYYLIPFVSWISYSLLSQVRRKQVCILMFETSYILFHLDIQPFDISTKSSSG